MRIDSFSPSWAETNATKVERQDRNDVASSRTADATGKKAVADDCKLSSNVTETGDVSRARVEELRTQVSAGTYRLNADDIAEAMLKVFAR